MKTDRFFSTLAIRSSSKSTRRRRAGRGLRPGGGDRRPGHGALAGFLRGLGVDTLICGGIGGGARSALAEAGIQLYPGASGSADAQVEALLAGSLAYDPNTVCSHHDHGEGIPADTITRAVTPAAAMTTAADITADWA